MTSMFTTRTVSRALAVAVALTGMFIATPARAAIYVQFEGIDGSSADRDHRNWCDVASFTRTVDTSTGGGTRRTQPRFSAITLVRELDKASPKLEEALTRGQVIPSVTLEVTASYTGAGRQTYYRVRLTNVRITHYELRTGGPEAVPTEEIALAFETVAVTYVDLDSRGRVRGNVEYSWNVRTGS